MKKDIEKDLLEIARREFYEKGFKGTSMRHIARLAEIAFSNIYYYYESKDALFLEVVKPLKARLDKMYGAWDDIDAIPVSPDAYIDEQWQQQSVKVLMELTLQYKQEFNLLLFNAHGSALEHIDKTYIDSATQSNVAYIRKLSAQYPELNIQMSEQFIRTMSAHTFTIIGEIVSQDLNEAQIKNFMQDFVVFNTSGWKGLLYKNTFKKELANVV
ncbi:TetR family transcriptional regulator [Bacteroides sp. 519]|uniref:TetR/AcrR family transcriptional regulator n=1 Tax=Bacteroides sp. 519 TaxID=2302937 RepID=UPI0013D4265B